MASAQVSSNSRKDHLEAGKKRLEEFRKKKAVEKAKKTVSTAQLSSLEAGQNEKQTSEPPRIGMTDSDGAGTSGGFRGDVIGTVGLVTCDDVKAAEYESKKDVSSDDKAVDSLLFANNVTLNSLNPSQTALRNENDSEAARHDKGNYGYHDYEKVPEDTVNDALRKQFTALYPPSMEHIEGTSRISSNYGLNEALSNARTSDLKDFSIVNHLGSDSLVPNHLTTNSWNPLKKEKSDFKHHTGGIIELPAQYERSTRAIESNNSTTSYVSDRNYNTSSGDFENSSFMWSVDPTYTGFSSASKSSSNFLEPSPTLLVANNSKRSRPSFLDSINVHRVSSASTPLPAEEKASSLSSSFQHVDSSSPAFPNFINSSVAVDSERDFLGNGILDNMERNNDFYFRKQNEDFAALEQHIEDLTQDKFSLQRALEAARTLAESLAAENSALTDTYNQQGIIMNQLKSDMEKLQEEIKPQLLEIESMKIEYANAQLECNAADERAKLLASEVISLEEKALRLRSSELKLERQLENSQAEISSHKKKISSLEKDRQDLHATIDALQEEKKSLQSKLRKASSSGNFSGSSKNFANKKDVSTTTEDLVIRDGMELANESSLLERTSGSLEGDSSSISLVHDHRQFDLENLFSTVPPDQMRMIQNINTLMSELALEKHELMQYLSAQSSESSKLKELNKELTRKLEVQTQRLELLTAQTMATNNISARPFDTRNMHDETAYADEGDEVVERVLGWIMKLFPGGPSRRRTSKLL